MMETVQTYDFCDNEGRMDSLPATPEVVYNWVNITDEFFTSIKDLQLGELLHDELFGLFEAMSAIEMMDPKMDAGMECNRGSAKPITFQQAVDSGLLKIDDLEPSELIGIMDATMSTIVSWLEGQSLAQTVFTNLYLHQPQSITNKILKTYCIAIYKLLDCIRDCINIAQVFEEEDFQPLGYGYRLGSNPQSGGAYDVSLEVTNQKCISALREQEDQLNRKIKSDPKEAELWSAVLARIKFTRSFYQALIHITKRDQHANADYMALLNNCAEMSKIVLKTMSKGTQPDENSDSPNPMGFEPMVNQRLLPPTFPRYTKIKARGEALQYLDELISRLRHAWKITSCTSFHSALDFFMELSRSGACLLSRSSLQLLYMSPAAGAPAAPPTPLSCRPAPAHAHAFYNVLRESLRSFVSPPALAPKSPILNNQQARDCVENFLLRCMRPFTALLQVCGHNRARQRDKLAHLLDDFAALQEEAESVDSFLHTLSMSSETPRPHLACFGTWILYHVLRIMIAYLLSGLELELYSVHEYHYIFWYLYEFLYGWLVSALSRADSIVCEQEARAAAGALAAGAGGVAGAGSGKDARKAKPRKTDKKKQRPYVREALMCQILQNMCGGYFKALVAFKLEGKIPQPQCEFDSEAVRYKHRFAPLSVMTPPQVHYSEFREMTQPLQYENPVVLYLAGCKHFQQARTLLESITHPNQEIVDLLMVAKTNFVVLKLLAGGHKKGCTAPPEFHFSLHRHFPIIKLP